MKTVRWLRRLVIASLIVKLGVWGTWWTTTVFAESAAKGPSAESLAKSPNAGLPPALLEQTRGFRELLDAVGERQQQLDAREKALGERETGLSQLEKAVADQVAKLETLAGVTAPPAAGKGGAGTPARPARGGAVAGPADGGDRNVEITRIYESMKAEEAAPILDKLDDDTLRLVLGRMKERQIGAILAAMNRDRAVALTKALAGTTAGGPAPAPAAAPRR